MKREFFHVGLDSAVSHYTTSFLNNGVTGGQLLNLRADDLEHLGVKILGHQEIILEAVEHLRHFVSTDHLDIFHITYMFPFSTMNWIKKICKP